MSFVPHLLEYMYTNNYCSIERSDKVIAKKVKWYSFFCLTVHPGLVGVFVEFSNYRSSSPVVLRSMTHAAPSVDNDAWLKV